MEAEVHNAAGGGRERGGGGGLGRDELTLVDAEGRARVEAVPSEPEEEGAEDDEGRVVAGHRVGDLAFLVEAALAGAYGEGWKEGREEGREGRC